MPNDVRLDVGGMLYGGWQDIRIQRSIEQIAGQFELAITERWSGQDTPRPIHPGEECQLLIDGEPVITGYVDDVAIGYDSGNHTVTISGRDKTGDLVDCTAVQFTWTNQTLLSAAERLCKPFGVTASLETEADGKFSILRQNPGDSVFATLDAAAKVRGVLLVSDGNGELIIARASKERIDSTLQLGENILSCTANFSHKDRFSEYTVATQNEMQDADTFGEAALHIIATIKDPLITRFRPLTVLENKLLNSKQAKERGEWERNVRYGKSQRIQYTVQGWHYAPGKIWPINRLVPVSDDYLGIDDDRLIVAVELVLNDSGQRTTITVAPREAFDLIPIPESGDNFAAL